MGATLANGGVNPVTKERIIDPIHCQHVLAVMVTAGLYEKFWRLALRNWLTRQEWGQRGMVTISPGKGGLAPLPPPLDEAGNSVRGQLVAWFLSEKLGLNLFASRPFEGSGLR